MNIFISLKKKYGTTVQLMYSYISKLAVTKNNKCFIFLEITNVNINLVLKCYEKMMCKWSQLKV